MRKLLYKLTYNKIDEYIWKCIEESMNENKKAFEKTSFKIATWYKTKILKVGGITLDKDPSPVGVVKGGLAPDNE